MDWSVYAKLAGAGMAGALVRQLVVHRGSILLWHKWEDNSGTKGIDLGIISSLFIGGVVGILVDQSPMTAFSWAITGSYLLEEFIKVRTGEFPSSGPLSGKKGDGLDDSSE